MPERGESSRKGKKVSQYYYDEEEEEQAGPSNAPPPPRRTRTNTHTNRNTSFIPSNTQGTSAPWGNNHMDPVHVSQHWFDQLTSDSGKLDVDQIRDFENMAGLNSGHLKTAPFPFELKFPHELGMDDTDVMDYPHSTTPTNRETNNFAQMAFELSSRLEVMTGSIGSNKDQAEYTEEEVEMMKTILSNLWEIGQGGDYWVVEGVWSKRMDLMDLGQEERGRYLEQLKSLHDLTISQL
ncbi:hypothetical protein TREMEDRAFT_59204 [Tremella mesenterica DSM 1558]|uniref:uncharacterized protein n=1 Tax=Tremella mesenterica (strain ATCC 24925 / CBS 8224 / DSM 1558 / NBRC 9311 / NRRL Y-6157 / RJB 2259-6 / UBC 559-6) TaxID=578456 RepID=UPI0003F48EBE|nr:uncharacterized protein TREMEDRAFT_59204 [Tremella mesenterica DSM 1558]EIW73041.1 hypothetical protein TREMEDRAFT_59204 [Tremella mesenterica DSM 1558]